tara:strand:+ start:407 stop:625 length:219 start_codon:yes stop_codon:yes gene_type:complete
MSSLASFFSSFNGKCINHPDNISDYTIVSEENQSLKEENTKIRNLLNLYKEEIKILKIQNKKLREDPCIKIT